MKSKTILAIASTSGLLSCGVAGCSSGATPPPHHDSQTTTAATAPTASGDACSAVTPAELKAATGLDFAAGKLDNITCVFDSGADRHVYVSEFKGSAEFVKQAYEYSKKATDQAVPGLGAEAYWTGSTLWVLVTPERALKIFTQDFGQSSSQLQSLATAEKIAGPAITRLGGPAPASSPSTTSAAAAGKVDVCSLITRAEVEAAVGVAFGAGVSQPQTCNFTARLDHVTITLFDSGADLEKTYDDGAATLPGGQNVPGLGTKAFSSRTAADTLWILVTPQQLLEVEVYLDKAPEHETVDGKSLATLKTIAQTALARL